MKTYRCVVKCAYFTEPRTFDFASPTFDEARAKLKTFMYKKYRGYPYEVLSITKTANLNG